jgi:hypothetical protein
MKCATIPYIKVYLMLIFISISSSIFGQLEIVWEAAQSVAESQFGNIKPRIVLNGAGEPVVVFGKNNGELYLARKNGAQFTTPQQLAASGGAYVTNWTSADIGSKGDTIYIVYKAYPLETGPIYLVRSFDGGATLSNSMLIDHQQMGVAWLPSLDVDNNGQPHVVYMGHEQNWTDPQYYIKHSTDQGTSFSGALSLTNSIPVEACDCCPSELVIDNEKQVLLYRNNNQNERDIFGVYSNNSGSSFASFSNLENLSWMVMSCPSTAPDGVIINDTLFSVSSSKVTGSYRIYLSKALVSNQITPDFIDSLIAPSQVTANQNHPRIKASDSHMAVCWHENLGSNYDVYVSVASIANSSALYTSKHIANESQTGNQSFSDLTLNGNEIHVVYQDGPTGTVMYRKGLIGPTIQVFENTPPVLNCIPNPVKDVCLITAPKQIKGIRILNDAGQCIRSYDYGATQFSEKLQLSMLAQGKYTIEVEFNNGSAKTVIIKL